MVSGDSGGYSTRELGEALKKYWTSTPKIIQLTILVKNSESRTWMSGTSEPTPPCLSNSHPRPRNPDKQELNMADDAQLTFSISLNRNHPLFLIPWSLIPKTICM